MPLWYKSASWVINRRFTNTANSRSFCSSTADATIARRRNMALCGMSRVFPLSTKLLVMSTYFMTVTSLSTPCLSRKWLSDKKILHAVEASLETSALLPGEVISRFHEILTLQQNLRTSIEEKSTLFWKPFYQVTTFWDVTLGRHWNFIKVAFEVTGRRSSVRHVGKCGQSQLQKW